MTQMVHADEFARHRAERRRKNAWLAFWLVLPAFAIYGVFNLYSLVMTVYYSFLNWSGISANTTFAGVANYAKMIGDSGVWSSLLNNLKLVVVSLCVQIPMGMIMALIINAKVKGMRFFRTVYFMPMLFSTVSTGIMWLLMCDPYFGVINNVLRAVGLGSWAQPWLAQRETALWTILIVICWQYSPQYMILLRAGMTNIPEDLYEAAKIDGASTSRQFWSITLPLLSGTIRTAATLSMVGSLKYFDLIWIMTSGNPNSSTNVLATYMYKRGFVEFSMGYASSIATFMFVVSLIATVLLRYFSSRKEAAL